LVIGLRRAADVTLGFEPAQLVLADLVPREDVRSDQRTVDAASELQERLRTAAGVERASWSDGAPLSLDVSRRGAIPEGYESARGEDLEFPLVHAGPGYFETLRMPLARGRSFTAADREGAPSVAIVNERFAERYWPNQDPIGRRLFLGSREGPSAEVVGVVRDARIRSITGDIPPYIFYPSLQSGGETVMIVRTSGPRASMESLMRRTAAEALPGFRLERVRSMEDQVLTGLLPQRIARNVLGSLGALAALLAAVGLYGLMALAVAARTREMGIRLALGSTEGAVVRLVLGDGARVVAIGIGIGSLVAWGALRGLGMVFGPESATPRAYLAGVAVLVVTAFAASWLPARRAGRLAPMEVLRGD
jgi:predicted permease